MTLLELAHHAGLTPKWVASTAGGEYSSACPACGGSRRFRMWPQQILTKCSGRYWCRECGTHGDAIQFARQFLNYSFHEAASAVNAIIPEKSTLTTSYNSHASRRPNTLQKPPELWIERATDFVNYAHESLSRQEKALAYLAARGLPLDAVLRYKFGWSHKDKYISRLNWGLKEELKPDGKPRSLWLPRGLVIPTHEISGQVIRIKVRRPDWHESDKLPKYVAISGSMNGLTILGSVQHHIMIVVESELDAYAINYAVHDLVCAIAVGSNIKNPDNVADGIAQRAKHLLICHDNDDAGKKMLAKWKTLYPHAQACPTPIGKDVGEAVTRGLDLRKWLLVIIENKTL